MFLQNVFNFPTIRHRIIQAVKETSQNDFLQRRVSFRGSLKRLTQRVAQILGAARRVSEKSLGCVFSAKPPKKTVEEDTLMFSDAARV